MRFAAEGARVGLLDPRDLPIEGGERTLTLIEREGGEAIYFAGDVTKSKDLDDAIEALCRRYGRLDVMVNNAAIYTGTNLLDTREEDWERVMSVNLKGVFLGCQRAIVAMLQQSANNDVRGRIINISSQHGMIACPGDIAYGVSKAGCV